VEPAVGDKAPARGPPASEAPGQRRSSVETRIEYDEGYDPRREDWETNRGYEEGPSGE
jgi:hypothetical protein